MYKFRENNIEDVTSEEFEKYINPHIDRFKEYVQSYVLPNLCAFYIYSGYQMEALYTNSLGTFINDVLSMTNEEFKCTSKLKKDTKKILEIKYGLIIENDDPLSFE